MFQNKKGTLHKHEKEQPTIISPKTKTVIYPTFPPHFILKFNDPMAIIIY